MELVSKELHDYNVGQSFYNFHKSDKCEYQLFLIEGYLGDRKHTFIENVDYELFENGFRWLLNGSVPEAPPSTISTSGKRTFEVTYAYEEFPSFGIERSIHPFTKNDGIYMSIVRALGNEIYRLFRVNKGVIRGHDLTKALGADLDNLAAWFNVIRFSGESDAGLRGRLLEFLDSYVSSGTIDSVKAAVEAYTDVEPDILELWATISYFSYNPDDYADTTLSPDEWRVYLFEGGEPDGIYTFQAYFYDEMFSLNTFFCILPYETIVEYGVENIKTIIQKAKAAGVQGYLGYLINDDFSESTVGATETAVTWKVVAP